jgi:Leucine-rich repeat (LRR) protein
LNFALLREFRSAALRGIRLVRTHVTDFSLMAGCTNLEVFDASDSAPTDLSPPKGMELRTLTIARTPVADLSVLAGMPLESVDLTGSQVTDPTPLLKCPTLTKLGLPDNAAKNIESLRALPKLERVSFITIGGEPNQTADQFWAANKDDSWFTALSKANITAKRTA